AREDRTMASLARALFLFIMLLPGAAGAQSAGNFSEAAGSPVRYTVAATRPSLACAALRERAAADTLVTAAVPVAAEEGRPGYCRVTGVIAPEIQFEVDLPSAWNRRFYMFGNGGYAGEDLNAPIRQALSANAL